MTSRCTTRARSKARKLQVGDFRLCDACTLLLLLADSQHTDFDAPAFISPAAADNRKSTSVSPEVDEIKHNLRELLESAPQGLYLHKLQQSYKVRGVYLHKLQQLYKVRGPLPAQAAAVIQSIRIS